MNCNTHNRLVAGSNPAEPTEKSKTSGSQFPSWFPVPDDAQ